MATKTKTKKQLGTKTKTSGGARANAKATPAKGRTAKAARPARVAKPVAAAKKAATRAKVAKPAAKAKGPAPSLTPTPDPEGFFVARVRGEEEVRHAPHPLAEPPVEGAGRWAEQPPAREGSHPVMPAYEEHLGDLPWSYGDDAFIALPRDPKTLFLYWDLSAATVRAGFEGLDAPRAELWVFAAQGEGWERVRVQEFAIESRTFYVHDLEPGRTYRAEIQAIDRHGNARRVGHGSNAMPLPPVGASSLVDDRFVRIPWDVPLPRLLGRGRAGGPFPEDLRALLARLSDWGRFPDRPWGGSVAGGAAPSSPGSAPSFFPTGPAGREGK